ncbi:sterol delta 5,6-desaturase ERG3 [Nadsonia fulvescens var. elongata DSM 6958]|uniref:Sterol delta 5,6-desaturase ERG3 n=1 Tax=Nadsonia fulvescens var. elongata DSM 6958 TaxID=857566 RepID=A0A1E3PJ47_9ASCO|nr:sterol delta 5,6-desaturase ERG3 [Nadsonia fulvescens var. elongata DSM 6958]
MDLVLEALDTLVFDRMYASLFPKSLISSVPTGLARTLQIGNFSVPFIPESMRNYDFYGNPVYFPASKYIAESALSRDNIFRQLFSFWIIFWIFGTILYYGTATLSYHFVFDKKTFNHPKYLKNQMYLEKVQALTSMPIMSILTAPWFVAEIRGYSKMYMQVESKLYLILQFPLFIMFTDFGIYLIHRGLHHRLLYRALHKPHHKWIMPTPYASHAFHPVDGYMQSLPYHIFPFIFPLHKVAYIFMFTFINIWTVMIHDGEYMANDPVINGAACHTVHHLYFNYNYGQFTTLWDRIGMSYRKPDEEFFDKEKKMDQKTWGEQSRKMEKILVEEEGEDDRVYAVQEKKNI